MAVGPEERKSCLVDQNTGSHSQKLSSMFSQARNSEGSGASHSNSPVLEP